MWRINKFIIKSQVKPDDFFCRGSQRYKRRASLNILSYGLQKCITKDNIIIHVVFPIGDSSPYKEALHGKSKLKIRKYPENITKLRFAVIIVSTQGITDNNIISKYLYCIIRIFSRP